MSLFRFLLGPVHEEQVVLDVVLVVNVGATKASAGRSVRRYAVDHNSTGAVAHFRSILTEVVLTWSRWASLTVADLPV